ncbi:MAG: thioredoxin family protein [Planctomycetota bacterium]|jgi:small redox-active disulfide protein 2
MKWVQVLGPGCPRCRKLAEHAEAAVSELGIEAEVAEIRDIDEIIDFGVTITPALAVDGEVKISGRVPSPDEIKQWLT